MAEPLLSQGAASFAMVRIAGAECLLLEAMRGGVIEPRDLAAFWGVVMHLNWRSGRCWARPPELAAAVGFDLQDLQQALERLIGADLLVEGVNYYDKNRQPYYALHPLLCTTGGAYRRRSQWVQFHRHALDPARVEEQAAIAGAARAVKRD